MSRILIIEDDMDLQEGLTYFLEKEGYEILTAGTKKAGMEILRKGLCDLVLLDCNLPDGSGFDICAESQEYGDIPILMLTARDTEMDEVKALETGRRGLYVQALFHRCAQSTDPEDPSGQETGEPACLRRDRAGERFMQSVQKRRRDPVQQGRISASYVLHGEPRTGTLQGTDSGACVGTVRGNL